MRTYLSALINGDEPAASAALGRSGQTGGLSEERFLDAQSRVTSVVATPNANGTYKVEAEIVTSKGTYYDTFTVDHGPNGYVITDHFFIKVQ